MRSSRTIRCFGSRTADDPAKLAKVKPKAPASNGCLQPKKLGSNWGAPTLSSIPFPIHPSKSHNHCAAVLACCPPAKARAPSWPAIVTNFFRRRADDPTACPIRGGRHARCPAASKKPWSRSSEEPRPRRCALRDHGSDLTDPPSTRLRRLDRALSRIL
jgi:hypothetical protein